MAILSWLTSALSLYCRGYPLLADFSLLLVLPFRLPLLLVLFCLFCTACPVLPVLYCLYCSVSPVLPVFLPILSCPTWSVLPVLCSTCPVLPFLFWLSSLFWTALGVLSQQQSCAGSPISPILAVLSWQSYSTCPVRAVLSFGPALAVLF